jgi:hypothetical protein
VEIFALHEIQIFADDASDRDLAAVFYHGKSLVHGTQQLFQVCASVA